MDRQAGPKGRQLALSAQEVLGRLPAGATPTAGFSGEALGEKGSLQTVMEPHLGRLVTAESSGEPPGVKPMLGQGQQHPQRRFWLPPSCS